MVLIRSSGVSPLTGQPGTLLCLHLAVPRFFSPNPRLDHISVFGDCTDLKLELLSGMRQPVPGHV